VSEAMNRDWPAGSWIPHKPETWPFVFATVKIPTLMREWTGAREKNGDPIYVDRWIPSGARVRIVMVSRLGDVGITDDLKSTRNYFARVSLDHLTQIRLPS
jgi:hypothetical protein